MGTNAAGGNGADRTDASGGAASRQGILNAALELFARNGYEGTSVRMIAERAGVSQGLMYNYFEGKYGLLRAIFMRGMADVRESFARAGDGASPEEALEALVRSALEIVGANKDFWRLSYGLRMQPAVLEGMEDDLRAWSIGIRREIERHFRAVGAAEPEAEAAALFGLIDGVAQHYVLYPDLYPLERVIQAIVSRYAGAESRRAPESGLAPESRRAQAEPRRAPAESR